MEFEYNTPSRGFKIRNKTDNNTWSNVGWVVMTTANQGHISGTVWHSNNDGAGSGLDADLWDGNQFSDYLNQSVKTNSTPTFNGVYLPDGGNVGINDGGFDVYNGINGIDGIYDMYNVEYVKFNDATVSLIGQYDLAQYGWF